jgi:hypothetical protein
MQKLWMVKVQVKQGKSQSQRVKGDMCHHCKGDMWHDRTPYSADVETPQGDTCGTPYMTWQGDLAIVWHKWTNCMLTCGNDRPMRGCHVETSHWPFMDKVI